MDRIGVRHGADAHVIHVKNLQLPSGVKTWDIWADQLKVQPALVTIGLELTGFTSAAFQDSLDQSTIHYGHLCKDVRQTCSEAAEVLETFLKIFHVIEALARKGDRFIVSKASLTLSLPKASAYGTGIEVSRAQDYTNLSEYGPRVDWLISYEKLRIMTVIGVNEQERTDDQAILLTCSLVPLGALQPSRLLGLERELVEAVRAFTFETLEALAMHAMNRIDQIVQDSQGPGYAGSEIRLLLEKPSAVVFADAPAIEIRRVPQH